MAEPPPGPSAVPAGAGRRGFGALLAPALAVVFYVAGFAALIVLVTSLAGEISRDRIWKVVVFWFVYTLPALPAPALAARATGLVLGAAARTASYWPLLVLLAVFTLLISIWGVLSGGALGVLAAALQLGTAWFAWRLLRRATA
jgi:hypothetical protein